MIYFIFLCISCISLIALKKIRILVGLNVDKKTVETIKIAKQQTLDFNNESHTNAKSIISAEIINEVSNPILSIWFLKILTHIE